MELSQQNQWERVSDEQSKRSPRILIADDDPDVVRVLSARCRKMGADVITASNGLQAILKAKQNFPDFVIIDINMPEVDGFNVCHWLLDPDRPPLNVIVLTGNQDEETLERCDALGTYHVLKSSQAWENVSAIVSQELGISGPQYQVRTEQMERVFEKKNTDLPAGGARILIVEDDPDMMRILEPRMRKLATVYTASNGIDGYRVAMREKPHLIISDYVMPEGGGHYLVWRLRAEQQIADIPILMITGDRSLKDQTTFRNDSLFGQAGPTRVFFKPLFLEDLIEEVKKHLPARFGLNGVASP